MTIVLVSPYLGKLTNKTPYIVPHPEWVIERGDKVYIFLSMEISLA